jgi:hypothetical protein
MATSITRRANTLNVHFDLKTDSSNDRKVKGSVTISDQCIGTEGWWINVAKDKWNEKPTRKPLIPVGRGSFQYPDSDDALYSLDLEPHFPLFNQWFAKLRTLSMDKPTGSAKDPETGEVKELQWSTGTEPYTKITVAEDRRYYVIRPLLYKEVNAPADEKRKRRLLISIHNVYSVTSNEDEDW